MKAQMFKDLVGITALIATLGLAATADASPSPKMPVYRAEVIIDVCDEKGAGTDDAIAVSLNTKNFTWLNYGPDDFERDSTFRYDLSLDRIERMRNIKRIHVYAGGNDGVKLCRIALNVNGRRIYTQTYPDGQWLDGNDGRPGVLKISGREIKRGAIYQRYRQPTPPSYLSRGEIESRIESVVGDTIENIASLKWGRGRSANGRTWVEAERKDASTMTIDLDLRWDRGSTLSSSRDPSVDVDFDLVFDCTATGMKVDVRNLELEASVFVGSVDHLLNDPDALQADPRMLHARALALVPFSGGAFAWVPGAVTASVELLEELVPQIEGRVSEAIETMVVGSLGVTCPNVNVHGASVYFTQPPVADAGPNGGGRDIGPDVESNGGGR